VHLLQKSSNRGCRKLIARLRVECSRRSSSLSIDLGIGTVLFTRCFDEWDFQFTAKDPVLCFIVVIIVTPSYIYTRSTQNVLTLRASITPFTILAALEFWH
jgi:hypothetical protein